MADSVESLRKGVISFEAMHALSKPEIRRTPLELLVQQAKHAREMTRAPLLVIFILSISAGSFICFGAALSIFLSDGVSAAGPSNLLASVGFSVGFYLVIISGSVLFTEVNVSLPVFLVLRNVINRHLYRGKFAHFCWRCIRFWMISWIGNLLGAMFVAALVRGSDILDKGTTKETLQKFVTSKRQFFEKYANGSSGDEFIGWWKCFLSALLGNWLVGMAAFGAGSARTIPGKYIAVATAITAFVSLGVQHSPANMGYFSLELISRPNSSAKAWWVALLWNIVPASLGNLMGGVVMVALLFSYVFIVCDSETLDAIENRSTTDNDDEGSGANADFEAEGQMQQSDGNLPMP